MSFTTFAATALGAMEADGKALILTCMDYRYPRRVLDVMQRLRPGLAYDQFILAGAALGACRKDWRKMLVDHVVAANVHLGHNITDIFLLDHRDCGAYKKPRELGIPEKFLKYGLDPDVKPNVELRRHRRVFEKVLPLLRQELAALGAKPLRFHALLMTRETDDWISSGA